MSMTMMAVYGLLAPAEVSTIFRMFLLCRTSRVTIMSVRRTLSEGTTE